MPDEEAISEEGLRVHVAMLEGPRHPGARTALDQAADYIGGAMGRMGLEATDHTFEFNRRTYRNMVGRIGRSTGQDLLIGAHYDAAEGSPGADDNASGVAVLLEVARSVASMRLRGGLQFVAFALGEEEGRAGPPASAAYAADLRTMRVDLTGAILLDCVGFTAPTQGQVPGLQLPAKGDFLAVVTNGRSRDLAEALGEAGSEAGLRTASLVAGPRAKTFSTARSGDHLPFWAQNFRGVLLTDTAELRNPNRHQNSDTHDTLDFPFLVKVANSLQELILRRVGLA